MKILASCLQTPPWLVNARGRRGRSRRAVASADVVAREGGGSTAKRSTGAFITGDPGVRRRILGLEVSMSSSAEMVRCHTLGDLLRRTAARLPDKTAVICGDLRWSYAELDRIVNRLANGRAALGIARGDRVAILSRNSHAFVALRFAVARLGAVLVPINFMLNADEVAYVLRHAGARLLAVGPDFVELAGAAVGRDTAVE